MGVGVAAAVVGAALRATGDGRHGTDAVPNYAKAALLRVARMRAHGVRRATKCMSGGRDLARRHGTSGSGDEWATADAGTERLERSLCRRHGVGVLLKGRGRRAEVSEVQVAESRVAPRREAEGTRRRPRSFAIAWWRSESRLAVARVDAASSLSYLFRIVCGDVASHITISAGKVCSWCWWVNFRTLLCTGTRKPPMEVRAIRTIARTHTVNHVVHVTSRTIISYVARSLIRPRRLQDGPAALCIVHVD